MRPALRDGSRARRAGRLLPALLLVLGGAARPAWCQQVLSTAAGSGPEDLPAVASNLYLPTAITISPAGEMTVATLGQGRVFRIDAQGMIHVAAGADVACPPSPYGDGGSALASCLASPSGLAYDPAGNLVVADTGHHAIRRIDALTGVITRVAGSYSAAGGGDGGPATSAFLSRPSGIAFDAAGNLYVADRDNNRVRRIAAATGIITTVAGTGVATGSIDGPFGNPSDNFADDVAAVATTLNSPRSVALDPLGNLLIGDSGNHRVRKVDAATGIITTVAGNGTAGWLGDGVEAVSTGLAGPAGIVLDAAGNLFIADSQERSFTPPEIEVVNHRVRRVDAATGIITTVAGSDSKGYAGDGAEADGASLNRPTDVALDAQGNLLIVDTWNARVRKVDLGTTIITTAVGNGAWSYSGDGQPAARGAFEPEGIEFDAAGNLYIADAGNGRVRRIDAATGIVTTIAGNGDYAAGGDGGPATAASLMYPYGLALDAAGWIYIADWDASTVRRVDTATGIITRVAGTTGVYGYEGDGGNALNALLDSPEDVEIDGSGDLYIADTSNHVIRRVRGGTITTVAGTGFATGSIDGPGGVPDDDLGDGGPARQASLFHPEGMAVDPSGGIVFAEGGNSRVRRYDPSSQLITTVAGDGVARFAGDGGPAAAASLNLPTDVVYDAAGNLYIADAANRRVRRVDALTGVITTVAGSGSSLYAPDGTAATAGGIPSPDQVAISPAGRLVIKTWPRLREVAPAPLAAGVVPDGTSPPERHLDVRMAPGGALFLSWGASCVASDNDYVIYEGALGDWSSHAPLLCSTAGALGATVTPSAGSRYYLVVPRNPLREGSLGTRSDGSGRPEGTGACVPRLSGGVCP